MTSMETSAREEFAFGSDHLEGNSLPFRKIGTITNAGSTWLTQSYLRRSGGVTQPNGEYLAVGLNSAGQASSIPQIGRPLPSQQSILSAYHRHPSDTFGLTIAIPTLSQIKIKPSFASGLQSAKITNEFKSPRVLATSLVSKNRRFLSPRAGTPCYPTPCLTSSSRFQIAN